MNQAERTALRRIDKQFDAIRSLAPPTPARERHRNSLERVGVGGYLRIQGALYLVREVSVYKEKRSHWTELGLFNLESGESRYLEWEKDDALEISFVGKPLSLKDLDLDSDEVEEMADEEEGEIRYGGKRFSYDDDYGAHYFRGAEGSFRGAEGSFRGAEGSFRGAEGYSGAAEPDSGDESGTLRSGRRGQGDPVYFYDFETEDERFCLSIEEWGDKSEGYSYEAFVSEYLEPEELEIYLEKAP